LVRLLLALWLLGLLLAVPAQAQAAPSRFISEQVGGLTVTPTTVYWHAACGDDFSPSRSFLRRAPAAGGAVETRYAPRDCAAGAVASANIAVDASHVYWLERDGRVVRQAIAGPSAAPTLVARTARTRLDGYPPCCWIALDTTAVYWSEGRAIYRAPKDGGPARLVYTESTGPVRDLQANLAGTLFYLTNVQLRVLRPTEGAYHETLFAPVVATYTLANGRLYLGRTSPSPEHRYVIESVRQSDLRDFQRHVARSHPSTPQIRDLAVDGTHLYWHETFPSSAGGPLWRQPLDSGFDDAVALTGYRNDVAQLQVAHGHLFWTDYHSGVWQLATGAPPVTSAAGDLQITDIHVTQSVQTDDNRVPLLGDKITLVRVFVRGLPDAGGPWGDVVARLRVDGDSTFYHQGPIAVSEAGGDRGSLEGSFTFVLSPAATTYGIRTMTVSVSSFSGRLEANTANNVAVRILVFTPAQHRLWYGMTYGNTNTNPACRDAYAPDGYIPPFDNFEAHRQFTENLFPLSSLTIVPVPGRPRQLIDNSGACGAYERAHLYLAEHLARLFPDGGARAFLLQPESVGYHGWCCTGNARNQVARGQDLRADPGPTMAHEMGHAYGRNHTFEDGRYPRPAPNFGGRMGPYLGFRLRSNAPTPQPQVIRGTTDETTFLSDIMAYARPQWISPYTYCLLADSISGGGVRCPAGLDGIPTARASSGRTAQGLGRTPWGGGEGQTRVSGLSTAPSHLYVSGYVDEQGKLVLEPFEQLALTGQPAIPDGDMYQLTLETAQGGPLPGGSFGFDIELLAQDGIDNPQPQTRRGFGFYIPWNPATERIVVRQAGQIVAERVVSPKAPEFLSVDFGVTGPVSGSKGVHWQAQDVDGDLISFSLWYSPDNGQGWQPVDVLVRGSESTVDFDTLPASQQARLRVLASDGVHTTAWISEVFSVLPHRPQVSLSAATDASGLLSLASASAYDSEDGAITDPAAFSWRSDWQGEVGRGRWLGANVLAPGEHLLTVEVRDSAGATSSATSAVSVPARGALDAVVINPSIAGRLRITSWPEVTLTLPVGVVGEAVRLSGDVDSITPSDLPGLLGSGFTIQGVTSGGAAVRQLTQPATVLVTYGELLAATAPLSSMAGAPPLALVRQDEQSGAWVRVPATIDVAEQTITAQVRQLGRFAVVALPARSAEERLFLPLLLR